MRGSGSFVLREYSKIRLKIAEKLLNPSLHAGHKQFIGFLVISEETVLPQMYHNGENVEETDLVCIMLC